MHPRIKVDARSAWNCDELSPSDLIESLHLERAAIDQDDFSRAEWFWSRRPRILCANFVVFFCYLIVIVCLFYFIPETSLFLIFWIGLGASCVFLDSIRLRRWGNEYELSISRIIGRLSNRK
jgi:hypothetical protein